MNKVTENVRKYQTEITELKNLITELKNSKGFHIRLDKEKKSMDLKTGQWNSSNQKSQKIKKE